MDDRKCLQTNSYSFTIALLDPLKIEFREDSYNKVLFTRAGPSDVTPHGSVAQSWRPGPSVNQDWKAPEPWKQPNTASKEQQASILHHKQALTSEGSFRFEYASDNGLAAGEVIEPDGSRVGAYQYKDPSGQLVKLKYRAGKEGFQILEGSHLPQSPLPEQPRTTDNYYKNAYEQQKRQYQAQQEYNHQKTEPDQEWTKGQNQILSSEKIRKVASGQGAGGQYFNQNWKSSGQDDGQYRDNDIPEQNRGPHSFGEGYAFSFKG
ncbi:unnamed protein product [Parnassius mnemosyne]|uniref:Uncharacterized protein n=1 Tax=Parnassius mnemosyne TaxID=213953 RepID=A0AAV1L1E8_9NEOP